MEVKVDDEENCTSRLFSSLNAHTTLSGTCCCLTDGSSHAALLVSMFSTIHSSAHASNL
eukprot:m.180637 g.180637  ORF g.180637 m.180637 type:complete len:59 (-) comp16618_c1_seq1:145-321(-)